MLGFFSSLFAGFDDNPDKLWVFVKVTPRPRLHVEWEVVNLAMQNCGIKDFRFDQATDNPVIHVEQLSAGIAFQISRENLLLLNGETFKASSHPYGTKDILIFGNDPLNDQPTKVASDDSGRDDKYAPKIWLAVLAPERYPEKLKNIEWGEQTKGACCQNWKEIVGRYLQKAEDVFKPIWRHRHIEKPNAIAQGREHSERPAGAEG